MKKIWKKVLASSLAFICTVTAGVAAIVTGGFGLFNAAQVEGFDYNKQLSFGNFFGNGIMLTASAAEANTGTSVFESVVSDAGTVSSLTTVNMASTPFAYRDLTLYENQTVVKIGIPVKTVTDYTADSLFTVYVVSYDEPLTTFTQVSEHKLTIPANTFTSNTVNEWYYFDTNIVVGENQTLGFTSSSDTICWGFLSSSKTQYALYNKLFSGYGTSAYGFFDVYTSDSTTPSTPATAPEGSVTLNATLDASGTIYNDDIGWEYAFQNPSSTWASGKKLSDYMSFTVSEDTHSATFTCKAAFGEPIIVTAKSEENPECTATCQFDYVKRITGVSDSYPNASSASYSRYIRIGATNTVTADVTYGVGTVTPHIDILDIKVPYSNELISVITSNISSGMTAKTSSTQIVTCTPKQGSSVTGSFNFSLTDFYGGGGDPNNLNNAIYNNAYNAETGEGSSYCAVKPTIKIAVTYGDVTYQIFSWTAQGSVRLEKGALKLKTTVTSVTIDNSNVVF